jgi:hypothetical protein
VKLLPQKQSVSVFCASGLHCIVLIVLLVINVVYLSIFHGYSYNSSCISTVCENEVLFAKLPSCPLLFLFVFADVTAERKSVCLNYLHYLLKTPRKLNPMTHTLVYCLQCFEVHGPFCSIYCCATVYVSMYMATVFAHKSSGSVSR